MESLTKCEREWPAWILESSFYQQLIMLELGLIMKPEVSTWARQLISKRSKTRIFATWKPNGIKLETVSNGSSRYRRRATFFQKNPLPAQTRTITQVCQVLFVLGEKFLLPLPFPIFDLVHVQSISFFRYRWTAVYKNSIYPVTGLPVTRTAQYPVTFGISL